MSAPAFEHVRGARVTQQMATAFEARGFHPVGGHAADDVRVKRVAVGGEEQGRRVRVQAQARAHFLEIAFEPGDGARADRLRGSRIEMGETFHNSICVNLRASAVNSPVHRV